MSGPEPGLPGTEDLYEDAACGLLITSTDGTIRRANRTFCRWLGLESRQLVGQRKLQDLLTMGGRIFHQTHWAPLLQIQGSIAEVKLDLRHADGHALPMVMNAMRRTHAGATWHEVSVVIATDRHQFEKELIHARKHAEELLASEMRTQKDLAVVQERLRLALDAAEDRAQFAEQMVGIVSHDLRNPLTAMQMSTNVLSRSGLTPAQRRAIERIDSAARRSQRLITDLLDFTQARLGSGLAVAPRAIDFGRAVADGVEELATAYPAHELRHRHHGSGDCIIDPDRLAQLLGNLVSNAFAYGATDRPVIVTSSVGHDSFSVAVHNHGTPIPPPLMERMFDAMTRGAGNEAGTRGVGLGLFIVRAITQAHHGEVSVASSEDSGTTFTATFRR